MATSTDLRIRITAQDQASPALGRTRTGIRSISEQLDQMRSSAVTAFGAMMGVQSAREIAALADQVQGINSRLLIAVGSQDAFNAAQARAYAISAQTGAGYEATATLLTRLSQVGEGYGLTQEQIATTTEVTAKALQLSGAAASESSAVIRQLSQALGSGVLRGEEFNSIMENGPRLAKALADGLGLPIGKLRSLAEQGLLTTDVVTKALESQRGTLEAESANYQRTMGQAASHVSDEFGRMVDAANQWTGAGQGVAASMDYVANHMQAMLGGVAVAAVAGLTVAVTRGGQAAVTSAAQHVAAQNQQVASTIRLHQAVVAAARAEVIAAEQRLASVPAIFRTVAAEQALVTARANLTTATTALNTVQAESTIVARGLSAVVSGLGGPIGIITTLLTAGATAWMIWGDKAETAAGKAKSAAEEAEQAIRRMRNAQSFGEDAMSPFRADVAASEAMLAEAKRGKSETVEGFTFDVVDEKEVAAAQAKVSVAYARLHEAARLGRKKIEGEAKPGAGIGTDLNLMGKSFDGWVDKFRDKLDPLGAALKELGEKAKDSGVAVGSQQYKDAEALIRKSFEKKGSKSSAGPSLDLDNYGKSALAEIQAESQRKMDLLKANLASEMAVVQRGYDAGTTSLEAYYAERRRVIETESQAEIQQQQQTITQAQAEIARLQQLKPQGTRGAEQISDQTRALDEKIKDAQAKIDVLKVQTTSAVADISADQAKAARERLDTALSDAQAVITATEQSLQSRVVTGLETEATARAKLKDTIREQGQALEQDLVPQIERMMLVAGNPKARAELQAMLDKIREMAAEAQTQTWADGMIQGVQDYATEASDAFQTAKEAASQAFSSMEDALVEFTTTGKLSVSDMVQSMLADIARLAIRQSITQPLASGLAGAIGSLLGGTAFNVGAGAALGSSTGTGGGFNMGGGAVTGLATGGPVSGPGTGTSDSIPAMLSNGEYVIRESVVRSYGQEFFDRINAGERPAFRALGGPASGPGTVFSPQYFSSGGPVRQQDRTAPTSSVSVEIHNHSGQQVQQREITDARGGRKVQITIGDMVAGEMARPGSAVNKSIRNGFGLRPALAGR